MFDYFYSFDKLCEEMSNGLKKGTWYKYLKKDGKEILILDIAGIDEKDLKIDFVEEGYNGSIVITGKTETEFGTFEINKRFNIPVTNLSNESNYSIKNGMLYITIVPEKKNNFKLKKAE